MYFQAMSLSRRETQLTQLNMIPEAIYIGLKNDQSKKIKQCRFTYRV